MSTTAIYSNPDTLGKPLSAYSHVAQAGDMLFVAGQCGIDVNNASVADDVHGQTLAAYENVRISLESRGASLRDVVRFVTYLTDRDHVAGLYAARDEYFAEHLGAGPYPPNTLLIVQGLVRPDLLIEIDATARVGQAT